MKCKDKNEQIRYVLFVMSAVKKLDSKAAKKLLQAKSISFATEEEVTKVCHVIDYCLIWSIH